MDDIDESINAQCSLAIIVNKRPTPEHYKLPLACRNALRMGRISMKIAALSVDRFKKLGRKRKLRIQLALMLKIYSLVHMDHT